MRVLVLALSCCALACGGTTDEEEKDYEDVPAIITFIDAGVDTGVDAEIDTSFDYCYEERVSVAAEAEKCTDDLMTFWKYMEHIDELPCDKIRSGEYPRLC